MFCIRGAITVPLDLPEDIFSATKTLLYEILEQNKLDIHCVTAVFFSCTRDLTSAYPAQAAREIGFTATSLMCLQEMHVEGSLEKCIRVCMLYNGCIQQSEIKHVYLEEAVSLRPDLAI